MSRKIVPFRLPADRTIPDHHGGAPTRRVEDWVALGAAARQPAPSTSSPQASAMREVAMTDAVQPQFGMVLMLGGQDMSRAWFGAVSRTLERNWADLDQLLRCRTPQDFWRWQSRLAQDSLRLHLTNATNVARLFAKVSEEAADTIPSS